MSKQPVLHLFPKLASASQALAEWVGSGLRRAVEDHGQASAALPGGSTPGPFLVALAKQDLPWKFITLMPTDERFVPADHPRSNERMMMTCLAPALANGARWVSFAPDGPVAGPESLAAGIALAIEPRLPLSVVVSGMGDDGHIASLFPGDDRLADPAHLWPVVAAAYPRGHEPRLTLSPPVLRASRQIALLFSGLRKQQVFADALLARDKPVALLTDASAPLNVFLSPD
ncbi:MAG: 6-phosphogluconolactonase [Rhizobiales bacterium]|nr:6-phosphogluconolactonase [Hyphomicrobiales bacterium]